MTPHRRGLAIVFGEDPATMQKSDRRTERSRIVGGSVLYHSLSGLANGLSGRSPHTVTIRSLVSLPRNEPIGISRPYGVSRYRSFE